MKLPALFVSVVLLGLASESLAQEQPATRPSGTEALKSLLNDPRGLELSTGKQSVAKQFYFQGICVCKGEKKDATNMTYAWIGRKNEHAVLWVHGMDGGTAAFRTDRLLITPDPDRHGGLVIQPENSWDFTFKISQAGPKFSAIDNSNDTPPTIEMDPASILKNLPKDAKISLDAENRILIRTAHSQTVIELSPPESAYPITSWLVTSDNGSQIKLWDFHINRDPPTRFFDIDKAAVEKLGVPIRIVPRSDIMKLYQSVPDQLPNLQESQKAIDKLFEPDEAAKARLQMDDLLMALRRMSHQSPGQSEDAIARETMAMKNIRLNIWSYTLDSPSDESYSSTTDRKKIYQRLSQMDEAKCASELTDLLLQIVSDSKRATAVRLIALDALGEMGAADPDKLLPQLEAAMKDQPAELQICLATVRVRLGQAQNNDVSYLIEQWKNRSNSLALRARCMEALCQLDKLPEDNSAIDFVCMSIQESLAFWAISGIDRNMEALASCEAGRQLLLADFSSAKPRADQSLVFQYLFGKLIQLGKSHPSDKTYELFVAACRKPALDSASDTPLRRNIIWSLLPYGPPPADALAAEFIRQYLKADVDAGNVDHALNVMLARHTTLDYIPALEACFEKADVRMRQRIVMSALHGVPDKTDAKAFKPLVLKALADSAANVRSSGLYAVADLSRRGCWKGEDFLPQVAELAKSSKEAIELKLSLWSLQLASHGKFTIGAAPVDSTGWPDNTPEATKWWSEHGEELRESALKFLAK
ncbi:MAG: hypothetical protein FWD61_09770 [Phycisphaerales bacterium]|nr:hypothetical protein [Phycisphaerales bacterium]